MRLAVGYPKERRMDPMARLRSSLLGYRVTEAKRRYGSFGVSSGPIFT